MQPYQEASEEIQRQGELPLTALKKVGGLATSIGGGIALGKVMPFLSQYVPQDLAIKALNKVDPRFGKFINKAMENGKTFEEAREFIKGEAEESAQQEPAKEGRNIIQQYSPELFQFMENGIRQGRSPVEVAAIAQNNKDFGKVIKKMQQDHKTNWSDIVQSIFGNGQTAQPQQAQQQQPQGMGQPQQGKQQSGPGQQRMLNILQKINQRLGQGQ